jgi:WD40 repeat protein
VLSASNDQRVKLWDANGGQLLTTLTGELGFNSIAVSPDGERILTGSKRVLCYPENGPFKPECFWILGLVEMRAIASGTLLKTFEMGSYSYYTRKVPAAFSPDGIRVLAGYSNMKLWDGASGNLLHVLDQSPSAAAKTVEAVAFLPDGKHILGSCEQTIGMWDTTSGTLVKIFGNQQ